MGSQTIDLQRGLVFFASDGNETRHTRNPADSAQRLSRYLGFLNGIAKKGGRTVGHGRIPRERFGGELLYGEFPKKSARVRLFDHASAGYVLTVVHFLTQLA